MHIVEEVARKIFKALMEKDTDTHTFQMTHSSRALLFSIVYMTREEFAKVSDREPIKPMAEYGTGGRYVQLRSSDIEGSPPVDLALCDKALIKDGVCFRVLGASGEKAVEGLVKYIYEFLTENTYPSKNDALLH